MSQLVGTRSDMDADKQTWMQDRARDLRQTQTDAEGLVWNRVRARRLGGFKFRRQHVIGSFIVDFYCPEGRLAVEIDGPTHLDEADRRRDRNLRLRGIQVIRFTNDEIYDDLDGCMDWLLIHLEDGLPA